jgi:methylenetetrahydrofolate reductase (NADPH)
VVRKRPGTVGICAAIQNKYNVDAIPHILCGGFTKEDTENFLIDLGFLGIDNVMALRGDAVKSETYFTPEPEGHNYAGELVSQISDLNKGVYLDDEILNQAQTDFCIGVAGYPEKHMEAPSLDSDIYFLKKKIKKGATYIVTQMFFDNDKYFAFVDKCRSEGITVPIIPGLKPIATKKQLNLIPHRFSVELPDDLVMGVVKCKDNAAVRQMGVEWCVKQSKELIAAGVPILHYYSMGKSDNIKAIAEQVF